jgi:hypothetical protein
MSKLRYNECDTRTRFGHILSTTILLSSLSTKLGKFSRSVIRIALSALENMRTSGARIAGPYCAGGRFVPRERTKVRREDPANNNKKSVFLWGA